jgi:hypothetical protein
MRAPVLLLLLSLASAGCGGPTVDLPANVEFVEISSGWFDVGVVGGQNKLVPSFSFRVKKNSDQALGSLQVNALFRRGTETEEWGSAFTKVAGSEGLAPGATSPMIRVKSQQGYTGIEPRAVMLNNSQFVDARVELFAKYGPVQWVRMAEYPITRQLLAE